MSSVITDAKADPGLERGRLCVVIATIVINIVAVWLLTFAPWSDWRTGAALNIVDNCLLIGFALTAILYAGWIIALLWLVFRAIRAIEKRMRLWAARTRSLPAKIVVPIVGQSLRPRCRCLESFCCYRCSSFPKIGHG